MMIDKLTKLPVEELEAPLNGLLIDSWTAAKWLNLKPATLRNPKNKYYKLSIKIGQYRYWRKEDVKMFSPEFETKEDLEAAGWQRINPDKTIAHVGEVSIKCRDITNYERDGVDFGGKLGIVDGNGNVLATSNEAWVGGKYAQYFRADEVEQAIAVVTGKFSEKIKTA